MLFWVIQTTIVSVIFILVVHNIFHFLKNTLTVPKAKDLVDVHMEKYKHIYATLNKNDPEPVSSHTVYTGVQLSGTTNIDDIPMVNQDAGVTGNVPQTLSSTENVNMKNELKNFMKKQLGDKQVSTGTTAPQFMQL